MKRLYFVLGTAVVVLPWLSGARVQADAIQWSASANFVGSGATYNGNQDIYANSGAYGQIAMGAASLQTTGTNSGSVVLASLTAVYPLNGSQTANFSGSAGNYSLSLNLTDRASGASGNLTFNGNLSGYFNTGLADINNTFIGPTTQFLKLGSNIYTVTIGPFDPPSAASDPRGISPVQGTISASISVQPLTSATPEPSSLLLACIAVPPLGLARWLRRRKTVANNA